MHEFIAHESDKSAVRQPHSVNLLRHVLGHKGCMWGRTVAASSPAGGAMSLPADSSTWLTPSQVR